VNPVGESRITVLDTPGTEVPGDAPQKQDETPSDSRPVSQGSPGGTWLKAWLARDPGAAFVARVDASTWLRVG
jgi:hypothetical protein